MNAEKATIKSFLVRRFEGREIQDDEDIFSIGLIDSLFAMQLIAFIEKEFRIQINSEDLDLNNFRTINAMVNLIRRKRVSL